MPPCPGHELASQKDPNVHSPLFAEYNVTVVTIELNAYKQGAVITSMRNRSPGVYV